MCPHRGQSETAKLDVREDDRLKLVMHSLRRKKLRGSEVAAAGIVDHDVEMTRVAQRGLETFA